MAQLGLNLAGCQSRDSPRPCPAPGPLGSGPVAPLPASRLQKQAQDRMVSAVVPTQRRASSQFTRGNTPTGRGRERKGGFFLLSTCQTSQKVTLLPSTFNHSGDLCTSGQEEVSLLHHKASKAENLKTILKHFYLQFTNEQSLTNCSAAFEFSVMF